VGTKAQGSYFYDAEGNAILDFTSGQMCSVFGHNHPQVIAAMQRAGNDAIHLLSTILSPPVIELCEALADLLDEGLDKIILLNTGSESNECALRMAKLYTGGFEVVGFTGSWHGMTAGSQANTYSSTRRGYGPVVPGSFAIPAPYEYRCPIKHCEGTCDHSCLDVGMELTDKQSVGAYAAFIAEPILSAAGIIELSADYMSKLMQMCKERGMLVILDEAQTALGRTGYDFAYQHFSELPDFITLSKTLGGGIPLAATVSRADVEEFCYEHGFINITSHVSDPLPAQVGLAMLAILKEEHLTEKSRKQGAYLKQQLLQLQERYECIGDVRGRGLLLGMEIVKDRHSKQPDPDLGHRISQRCLEQGLSMNIVRVKGFGGVFRIAPPLTVSKEEIDLGISILDKSISDVINSST
jgi:2,2-dialkylglycine decarboxylase (pyruvate)